MIFLFVCLLLPYKKKAINLCKLTLYTVTLTKFAYFSISFLVEILGSLMYTIMSSPSRESVVVKI
ncbi:rCG62734 [Rattus norvegicus]|uniref:RCG62734 n=1 Tax=Rattus norvegicus TaxID=10116 RepID=A6J608_RAT|nr:rCG62734 [Rattus norvegicus]